MDLFAAPLPKKLLPLLIIKILERYSDEDHHLTQREILELLQMNYGIQVDRKTVHRNIGYLMEAGYPIECTETSRRPATGSSDGTTALSDFWLDHEFTTSELRLLIDSVFFSPHIPRNQRSALVEKLSSLSSKYFQSHVRHVYSTPSNLPQNPQLFYTISILDDAIEQKRKVTFHYLEFGTDKQTHLKRRSDGAVRDYVVSPYQMVAREGKYYLICNYDKYDDISNYRIDRIADIRILQNQPIKPFKSLQGADKASLDLNRYMAEHIYMYSSPNTRCVFRVTKPMVSDVIDMFGMDVSFSHETDTHVVVTAKVNERAMQQFAKNFGPDVIILEPKSLADKVVEEVRATIEEYGKQSEERFASKDDVK